MNEVNYSSTILHSQNGPINFYTPTTYQALKVISEGAQGIVVEAYDHVNARKLAIKKIKESYFSSGDGVKQCYREFVLGAAVQHHNVIRIKDAYSPQKNWFEFKELYLVFDLMDMNLAQLNVHYRNLFCDPRGGDFIASLMRQLLCAVKHLHLEKLRLIHRDIKPSNILIRRDNGCGFHLKLADLGSARQIPPEEDMSSKYVVTRPYRAPEIVLTDNYERPVDLWSVGCVLAELIINRVLFNEKDTLNLIYSIMQYLGVTNAEIHGLPEFVQQHVLEHPDRFENNHLEAFLRAKAPQWHSSIIGIDKLVDLTNRLLVFNPQNRITAEAALALPMWDPMGDKFFNDGISPEGVYIEEDEKHRRSYDQWRQILFNQLRTYNTMVPR